MKPVSSRLGVVAATVAVLGVLALGTSLAGPRMVEIEVSYPRNITTFEDLLGEADLVVQAKIDTVLSSEFPTDYHPVTKFGVVVEKTLKGPAADRLVVSQIGAKTKEAWFEVPENPLMQVGDRYILFLRTGVVSYQNQTQESVVLVGGPMGRFYIEGGSVRSCNTLFAAANGMGPRVDNVPLDRFWATLQSLAGSQ